MAPCRRKNGVTIDHKPFSKLRKGAKIVGLVAPLHIQSTCDVEVYPEDEAFWSRVQKFRALSHVHTFG